MLLTLIFIVMRVTHDERLGAVYSMGSMQHLYKFWFLIQVLREKGKAKKTLLITTEPLRGCNFPPARARKPAAARMIGWDLSRERTSPEKLGRVIFLSFC